MRKAIYDEGNVVSIVHNSPIVSRHPEPMVDMGYPLFHPLGGPPSLNHSFSLPTLSSPVVPPLRPLVWDSLIQPYPSRHVDLHVGQVVPLSAFPTDLVDQRILYSADTIGPSRWSLKFPECSKRFQSPIDIQLASVRYSPLPPIRILPSSSRTFVDLENIGATVALTPKGGDVLFRGGNLPGTFKLANIHFHWSGRDNHGSEHTVDGRGYSLEMHLVTYNTKYRDTMQALGKRDGIHVFAVLLQRAQGYTPRGFFLNLILGTRRSSGAISIASLLPLPSVPYFRYRGTLTTPPCTGNVHFTVFSVPMPISGRQV
ncbi:hypothetical protein EGW08_014342, partial [Elysia chlorotica]